MSSCVFIVRGEPVAKGRPKFTTRGGFVRAITPEKTANYETLVKLSFQEQCPNTAAFPKDVPLYVKIHAFFKTPKSASQKKLDAMCLGEIRPTKRPDCDNIAKIICDALNGIAYYDDSQVAELSISKHYMGTPYVVVEVGELKNGQQNIMGKR